MTSLIRSARVVATLTGESRRHHITGQSLPVVLVEARHLCGGVTEHDVVEVDGRPYYVTEEAGEWGLCPAVVALDAGDNEIARRVAPESTAGLTAAGRFKRPLTAVGVDTAYWLDRR